MAKINCKRCRKVIRGREPAYYCVQHAGIICDRCIEYCEENEHETIGGKISRYGEFIPDGYRKAPRRGRS